jgi:iron-sulfur cluster insertion protein
MNIMQTETQTITPAPIMPPGFITVTESAATKIKELLSEEGKAESGLRVFVQGGGCSGFQYGLMIEEGGAGVGDQAYESNGVKLFVDPLSFQYLEDTEIDYVEGVHGSGFKFNNPQVTGSCGCGSSVKF